MAKVCFNGDMAAMTTRKDAPMTTTTATDRFTFAAQQTIEAAGHYGFRLSVRQSGASYIVTATKTFTPGDASEYTTADSDSYWVLRHVICTQPGSTWGTTSDGVGGYVGLTNGRYVLNKSGVSAKFAKALVALLKSIGQG